MAVVAIRNFFNRNWRYYIVLFVFPLLCAQIGYGEAMGGKWRFLQVLALFVSDWLIMLIMLVWIGHIADLRARCTDCKNRLHVLLYHFYYPIAILPGLVALLTFLTGSIFLNPKIAPLLISNGRCRIFLYIIVMLFFAYWRLRLAKRNMEVSTAVVPISTECSFVGSGQAEHGPVAMDRSMAPPLQIAVTDKEELIKIFEDLIDPIAQDIASLKLVAQAKDMFADANIADGIRLYVFYSMLITREKGPVYNFHGDIRFFDIVLIRVRSKGGDIYLIDGTCICCKDIQKVLKERGLLPWMVRIHKSCIVNMMHVSYDYYKEGGHLVLQAATMERMREQGMKKMEILNLLQFGPDIGTMNIEQFIADRAGLVYGVWDTFVPIKKKNSADQ